MPYVAQPPKLWTPLSSVARETGLSGHLIESAAERGEIPVRLLKVGAIRQRTFVNCADLEAWRASMAQPLPR